MPRPCFEVDIDLLPVHLDRAGVPLDCAEEALQAVRAAVLSMSGAAHVDVQFHDVKDCGLQRLLELRCISLYQLGRLAEPKGAVWTALRQDIAEVIGGALAVVPGHSPRVDFNAKSA